jgi:hypothetical protein
MAPTLEPTDAAADLQQEVSRDLEAWLARQLAHLADQRSIEMVHGVHECEAHLRGKVLAVFSVEVVPTSEEDARSRLQPAPARIEGDA